MTNKKKTTTTRKRAPKKEMQYADGVDQRKKTAKTVEDLLRVDSRDPFHVTTAENFEDALPTMNLSQLQEIAVKAGVFPSGTKATLKNKLLKEYQNRTMGKYGVATNERPIVDPNSDKAKEILKILND